MAKTRIPQTKVKKQKLYRIVTKPTTEAFCQGIRVTTKTVSEDWLKSALLAIEHDPNIERYFYEEVKS